MVHQTIKPGTYAIGSESTSATLTADYADNTVLLASGNAGQLEIYIAYTPDENGRSISVQFEGGPGTSDVYKFIYTDLSTGTEKGDFKIFQFPLDTTTVKDTTYKIRVSESIADQYIRLGFKEDGAADFGTVVVRASLYSL